MGNLFTKYKQQKRRKKKKNKSKDKINTSNNNLKNKKKGKNSSFNRNIPETTSVQGRIKMRRNQTSNAKTLQRRNEEVSCTFGEVGCWRFLPTNSKKIIKSCVFLNIRLYIVKPSLQLKLKSENKRFFHSCCHMIFKFRIYTQILF